MKTEQLAEKDLAALRSFADRDAGLVLGRDWDGLAAQYTVDAVRMPPNQPAIEGRAAIRSWLEGLPPIESFTFRLVDLRGRGDIAFLRADYTMSVASPGGAPVSDEGKILVVFQRQADDSWLRVVDAWNSNLPPGT